MIRYFYQSNYLVTIDGERAQRFVRHGSRPLAQLQSMGASILGVDISESVCSSQGSGHGVASFTYGPYGTEGKRTEGNSALGFNGGCKTFDGFYFLGNGRRLYRTAIMRFLSVDHRSPFGQGGVNCYAYCAGDPINYADPSGLTRNPVSLLSLSANALNKSDFRRMNLEFMRRKNVTSNQLVRAAKAVDIMMRAEEHFPRMCNLTISEFEKYAKKMNLNNDVIHHISGVNAFMTLHEFKLSKLTHYKEGFWMPWKKRNLALRGVLREHSDLVMSLANVESKIGSDGYPEYWFRRDMPEVQQVTRALVAKTAMAIIPITYPVDAYHGYYGVNEIRSKS